MGEGGAAPNEGSGDNGLEGLLSGEKGFPSSHGVRGVGATRLLAETPTLGWGDGGGGEALAAASTDDEGASAECSAANRA